MARWPKITKANLRSNVAMREVCTWYAQRGIVPHGEYGLRIVLEAAENAIANGTKNQPGMFVRRVRDWRQQELFPMTNGVCDRAQRRMKYILYGEASERSEAR